MPRGQKQAAPEAAPKKKARRGVDEHRLEQVLSIIQHSSKPVSAADVAHKMRTEPFGVTFYLGRLVQEGRVQMAQQGRKRLYSSH